MKVFQLADILKTSTGEILKILKSLKLKAKDKDQELSSVVISVVKTEFNKRKDLGLVEIIKEEPLKKEPVKKFYEREEVKSEVENKGKEVVKQKKISRKKKTEIEKDKDKNIEEPVVILEKEEKVTKVEEKIEVSTEKKKPKIKISKEPVITLKPLLRKRKKITQQPQEETQTLKEEEKQDFSTPQTTLTEVNIADSKVDQTVKSLVDLELKLPISVKDLSVKLQQKPSVLLAQLMKMGILCHINKSLDGDIINKIANEFGFNIIKTKTQEEQLVEMHKFEEEDPKLLKPRAPVVTFMGHVDHGKTSLIDKIRKSKVVDSEHGGITQHMRAYSVNTQRGIITFLDTPGHEAFTAMRSRGAHITDIVVLVVAADEGVMPQTEEAINHARAGDVPIVVALNKIDKRNAEPDRVKKQLQERDLKPEDWGGNTIVVNVSAISGEGIDKLLEMILLEAEMLELKSNPDKKASGIVVEANLSQGKGAVTTLIIQSGTLREGDFIVVGPYYGKVRAMFDDSQQNISEAGPSMPVEVLGLSNVPQAGEMFYVVDDEKQAKEITIKRQEELKNKRLSSSNRITLEDLCAQMQQGQVKELSVIVKADVQGSLEALRDSLTKIPNEKVKIRFIHLGIGDVNASDVILAVASKSIIIAFNVGIDNRAKEELEKEPVDVRQYRIIYDAVNDVKNALEGMLEAKTKKEFLARVEIREVFNLSKHGIVAGCFVLKGKVKRKANIDIIRDGKIIYSGTISSLKRFKDDVREVSEGMECGITIEGFNKIQVGDIIESYDIIKIAQKL